MFLADLTQSCHFPFFFSLKPVKLGFSDSEKNTIVSRPVSSCWIWLKKGSWAKDSTHALILRMNLLLDWNPGHFGHPRGPCGKWYVSGKLKSGLCFQVSLYYNYIIYTVTYILYRCTALWGPALVLHSSHEDLVYYQPPCQTSST